MAMSQSLPGFLIVGDSLSENNKSLGSKTNMDTGCINVLAGYHASTTVLIIKQYFVNRDTKY